MINRDLYLQKLIHNMWNGEIKVITGIRRCGKSVLLFDLFYNYLLEKGTNDENIIKIELDQRRYYKYRNPITLCEYVESIVLENKNEKLELGTCGINDPWFYREVRCESGAVTQLY